MLRDLKGSNELKQNLKRSSNNGKQNRNWVDSFSLLKYTVGPVGKVWH